MASVMTHDEVVAALVKKGVERDRACQYADAFEVYQKASANIREFGPIIAHPRTGSPVPNPYLAVQAGALKSLNAMRDVPAGDLW